MSFFSDLFKKKQMDELSDPSNPIFSDMSSDDDNSPMDGESDHGFTIQLRRKRKAAMLKRMLSQQGYGDLAKAISIKEY